MVDQQALLLRLNKVEADMRAKLLLNEISLQTETHGKESGQGPIEEKLIQSPEYVTDEGCLVLINKFKQELQKERSRRVKMENAVIRLRASIGKMALNITDINVSKRMALGVARQLRKQNEGNQDVLSKFQSTKNENATLRKQLLEEKRKQQNLEFQMSEVERKSRNDSAHIVARRETGDAGENHFTIMRNDSPNWKYEETEQVVTSDEQIYHDCQSEPFEYEQNIWCHVFTQNINDQNALLETNKLNSLARRLSTVSLQEKRIVNELAKNTSKTKSDNTVGSELKSDIKFSSHQKPNFFKYEEISTLNHESFQKPLVKATSEISHIATEKHNPKYIYDWLRENINIPLSAKYFHNPCGQWTKDHSCIVTEEKLDTKLQLLEIESSRQSDEMRLQYREITMKLLEYKKSAESSNEELQKVRSHCVELQKQLDEYKKTVDDKLRTEILYRNKELENKLEECKKSSKEFQSQILRAESRYKDLAKELETLRQESDINNLQTEENQKTDILKQLNNDFTSLEDEFIAFKSEMESRTREKDKLIAALGIRERTIVEEREKLKRTIYQSQRQSTQYLKKIEQMSTTLSEQEAIITEQKEIMDDKKNEITEVAQSLEISRSENHDIREHLSFLKHQLYMTTNALNKLKVISIDMQIEENNVLKQELEQTRQQLNVKNSMVNVNEKQRIREQAICQMLERDLEEYKKQCSDLTEELKYYKQENEMLKESLKKLHTCKAQVEEKLDMFHAKCRKWVQWQREINTHQKTLNNQIQVLKCQRDNATNEAKHITQKLLKAIHKISDNDK